LPTMHVSAAFTAPVNTPGASPVLSHAQLWRGHEIKAEAPQPFVPVSECEVLERRANGLTRRVTFKAGGPAPPGTQATEDIEYFGNMRVRAPSLHAESRRLMSACGAGGLQHAREAYARLEHHLAWRGRRE
jgi:hypothetical protein